LFTLIVESGTSPFKEGLIVVMDGMGETYKAMLEDIGGVEVRIQKLMLNFVYCD
jgi:predicted NodU family carbamoyl transferase